MVIFALQILTLSLKPYFARIMILSPRLKFIHKIFLLKLCNKITDNILIPINYRLHIDYFLQRVDFRVCFDYMRNLKQQDLEKIGLISFARFYANKKMAKLRISTRKIRYPIKNFFKRLFSR